MATMNSWGPALAAALWLGVDASGAAVLQEDFASDPEARGWQRVGDAAAFHWDPAGGHLEVTWDSTRPNAFFCHPLGTVLAKDDDFSLAFDLRLLDIAGGIVPGRTGPFEIALGFLNLAEAASPAFRRGTSFDSPNLVEFDYFPAGYYDDPVLGYFAVDPTVSPTLISRSNEFASTFTTPLELTSNQWFRVALTYTASNHTLATTLLRDGQPYAAVSNTVLSAAFSDFRVDAVSITSYTDAGDAFDSVLAHGWVDNLVVTLPDPLRVAGAMNQGIWQVSFPSRTNWVYALERTADWASWEPAAAPAAGTGQTLNLQDTNAALPAAAFYRVRAARP